MNTLTPTISLGIITGDSADGQGGAIELVAGSSTENYSSRRKGSGVDGANVEMKAGDATSAMSTGGDVRLYAGHGLSRDRYDGGAGGSIELIAGGAHGLSTIDTGGDISLTGGAASQSTGGSVIIKSGPSHETSSGDMDIFTDDSGKLGVSGSINMRTGHSEYGTNGEITIATGNDSDTNMGGANSIQLEIGNNDGTLGGNINLEAGSSTGRYKGAVPFYCKYFGVCVCVCGNNILIPSSFSYVSYSIKMLVCFVSSAS